jgi:hypothetical protein
MTSYFDGRAPAVIPREAIPRGMPTEEWASLWVARPTEVSPEDYWIIRPAQERLDLGALRGLYPVREVEHGAPLVAELDEAAVGVTYGKEANGVH